MPTYNVLGGDPVTATTDLGLVEALRRAAQAWAPSVSIEDFMEGMATRTKTYNGATIRTDAVANFISDLKTSGVLNLT